MSILCILHIHILFTLTHKERDGILLIYFLTQKLHGATSVLALSGS